MRIITYEDYLNYINYRKRRNIPEYKTLLDIINEEIKEANELIIEEEPELYILTNKAINKKHDKLFRDLLDNKKEFKLFLTNFTDFFNKEDLSLKELEKYNRNFITKEYKERFADIVYKIKDEDIFIMIEHQSSIDYSMPFRILEYSFEIMKNEVNSKKIKTKDYELPTIIPIVIYTGNRKWKVSKNLKKKANPKLKGIGIQLQYNVIDINDYSEDELLEMNSIISYALALEKCKNDKELPTLLKKIIKRPKSEEQRKQMKRILNYFLKDKIEEMNPEDRNKILKELEESEVEKAMATFAEKLERGNAKLRKQIFAEGRTEGKMEGLTETAKMMLKENVDINFILRMTGLSKKELDKIKEKMA